VRTLEVRNVHEALPRAVKLLLDHGVARGSRNGPVLVAPWPVATVYERPVERVLFWPERDANPFFHLFESLWMLCGRDDLAPLLPYVKQMAQYSDDGDAIRGAYGARWVWKLGLDQLSIIVRRLIENPDDRRCVLSMWQTSMDLDVESKDLPCNLTATFQRDSTGRLDMVVFCRSNDIVWGCYGANAVHFSMLQEYLARRIGCPVGTYTQVSVNWHAYLTTLEPLRGLVEHIGEGNPYDVIHGHVVSTPMRDYQIVETVRALYDEATSDDYLIPHSIDPWAEVFQAVLEAHRIYRTGDAPARYDDAVENLKEFGSRDWCVAAIQWLERRRDMWLAKDFHTLGEA